MTLRSVGDGVIITDGWGRVLSLNPVAERLMKWRADEARGRPLREVFRVSRPGRSTDPFSEVLNRRQDAASWPRAVLKARDGTEREIAESVSALKRDDGDGFGVLVVFRDVSAQLRLEAELQKTQRLEALGVVGGGLAHDFNNILLGILGNLGVARQRTNDPSVTSCLESAGRAAVRARALAGELLALARTPKPVREVVAIDELLREAASFVLSGTPSTCELRVEPGVGACELDRHQIGRVIQNLVLNAAQAMPDGGTIRVHASRTERAAPTSPSPTSFVKITVSDEGPGIPPDVLDRLFEPYFTTKAAGSGLGLAVSQTIVAQHGGWIDAASSPRGATFDVWLPASGDGPAPHASPARAAGAFACRVLVVEDDEMVSEIAESMLSTLSCTVVLAKSTAEAEASLTGEPFDVVLVDLGMRTSPGGAACLRCLRSLGCTARAILSSGNGQADAFRTWRDDGFDGVLPKPYSLEELEAALRDALASPFWRERSASG